MALSSKQKLDVNFAIMGYFESRAESSTDENLKADWLAVAAAFALENPEAALTTKTLKKKHTQALERKWRSVLRLQNNIAKITKENEDLQDDLDGFKTGGRIDTAETEPKKVKHNLQGHREQVRMVKFCPNVSMPYLASCSEDFNVIIWDFSTGKQKKSLNQHKKPVEHVCWTPDGKYLLTCGEDTYIYVYDTETWKPVGRKIDAHDNTVSCILFNHDGSAFYTCSKDNTVKKWEFAVESPTRHKIKQKKLYNVEAHNEWVKCLALSPDGKCLASSGLDQVITLWKESDGEILWQFRDHDNAIECLAFTCSAACDANIIDKLEDPEDRKRALLKKGALKEGEDKGGMFLASASRDKTIMIWYIVGGVCVKTIRGHDQWVKGIVFQPSGRFLISVSDDRSIRMWDLKKNFRLHKKMEEVHPSMITCIDWHNGLSTMATGAESNDVIVWECKPIKS